MGACKIWDFVENRRILVAFYGRIIITSAVAAAAASGAAAVLLVAIAATTVYPLTMVPATRRKTIPVEMCKQNETAFHTIKSN